MTRSRPALPDCRGRLPSLALFCRARSGCRRCARRTLSADDERRGDAVRHLRAAAIRRLSLALPFAGRGPLLDSGDSALRRAPSAAHERIAARSSRPPPSIADARHLSISCTRCSTSRRRSIRGSTSRTGSAPSSWPSRYPGGAGTAGPRGRAPRERASRTCPTSGSTCRTSGSCTTGTSTTTPKAAEGFKRGRRGAGRPVVAAVARGDHARARGRSRRVASAVEARFTRPPTTIARGTAARTKLPAARRARDQIEQLQRAVDALAVSAVQRPGRPTGDR